MSDEPETVKRPPTPVERAIDIRERIDRERRIMRQIREKAVLSGVRRDK